MFGQKVTFNIPRYGDFFNNHDNYINIKLPLLDEKRKLFRLLKNDDEYYNKIIRFQFKFVIKNLIPLLSLKVDLIRKKIIMYYGYNIIMDVKDIRYRNNHNLQNNNNYDHNMYSWLEEQQQRTMKPVIKCVDVSD